MNSTSETSYWQWINGLRGIIKITSILSCLGLMASPVLANDLYIWVGAGTEAGQEEHTAVDPEDPENTTTYWSILPGRDNVWTNPNNWEIDGAPAGSAPSLSDDVRIDLDSVQLPSTVELNEEGGWDRTFQFEGHFAVVIPTGAQGGNVRMGSGVNNSQRRILFDGEATFDSLNFVHSGGASGVTNIYHFSSSDPGPQGILNIAGGDATTPALDGSSTTPVANRQPMTGPGLIRFTNEDIFLDAHANMPIRPDVEFTNPNATIDGNDDGILITQSTVTFSPNQTLVNFPQIRVTNSQSTPAVIASTGGPLHNMSEVLLASHQIGRHGNLDFAAGTYRAILIGEFNMSSNSSPTFTAMGDFTIVGEIGEDGHGSEGHAIRIQRRNVDISNSNTATLDLDGHDLTVTSTYRVQVGGFDSEGGFNRMLMDGSNVEIAGDLGVGLRGHLVGDDETVLSIGGDFEIRSTSNSNFNLSESTVHLNGSGSALDPQLLELPGTDFGEGESAHSSGMAQFGIGDLIIGNSPTYVQLVDLFDFSDDSQSDALYVGSLTVNEGSTLDLNHFNLYVDGTLVQPGTTSDGGLIVIPEPKFVTALLALSTALFLLRRRSLRSP